MKHTLTNFELFETICARKKISVVQTISIFTWSFTKAAVCAISVIFFAQMRKPSRWRSLSASQLRRRKSLVVGSIFALGRDENH